MKRKDTVENLIRVRAIFNAELSNAILEKDKDRMIKQMKISMVEEEYSFYEVNYDNVDMEELKNLHIEDLESDLSWAL